MDNFGWVIKGELAGMARPGITDPLEEDMRRLYDEGVRGVISLTETAIDADLVQQAGLAYAHVPVVDFTPPDIEQIEQCVAFVDELRARASDDGPHAVCVHCAAGVGRTGTMLACLLVARGFQPEQAIGLVRQMRPGSIETQDQESRVHEFHRHLTR